MATLTVTAKGQITLRKEVLEHLGVKPGDKIDVELAPNSKAVVRAQKPKRSIESLFGMLKREGEEPLSLEDIKRITEESWAGIREDNGRHKRAVARRARR